jgi:arginine exporter protein ArgO
VSDVWRWGPAEGDAPLYQVIYKSITFSRFVACPLMDMMLMCVSVIELAVLRLLSEDLLKSTARRGGVGVG